MTYTGLADSCIFKPNKVESYGNVQFKCYLLPWYFGQTLYPHTIGPQRFDSIILMDLLEFYYANEEPNI